jgi:hypothetical protein
MQRVKHPSAFAKATADNEGETRMKQLYLFIAILTIIATVTFQAHGATATASIILAVEPIEDLIEDIETNIEVGTALVNDYYVGETMTLTAIPSDLTGYTYTWYKGETEVGTGAIFEIPVLILEDAGNYSVQLENQCGDTSIATEIVINIYDQLTVEITSNPPATEGQLEIASCGEVRFAAVPSGGKPGYTYQWLFETEIVGTEAELLIEQATMGDVGEYSVTVEDAMGRDFGEYAP